MKVLFLDVDGVLNKAGTRERSPHGTYGVEPEKIGLLRQVVTATDCKIVLSSTWRRWEDMVAYLMREYGEGASRCFIGQTPVLDQKLSSGIYVATIRGDEVQAWLDGHPGVLSFAIVDDDSDFGPLSHRLVRTHGCEGLTKEKAEELITLLNN